VLLGDRQPREFGLAGRSNHPIVRAGHEEDDDAGESTLVAGDEDFARLGGAVEVLNRVWGSSAPRGSSV
jgi:hypothetical protein